MAPFPEKLRSLSQELRTRFHLEYLNEVASDFRKFLYKATLYGINGNEKRYAALVASGLKHIAKDLTNPRLQEEIFSILRKINLIAFDSYELRRVMELFYDDNSSLLINAQGLRQSDKLFFIAQVRRVILTDNRDEWIKPISQKIEKIINLHRQNPFDSDTTYLLLTILSFGGKRSYEFTSKYLHSTLNEENLKKYGKTKYIFHLLKIAYTDNKFNLPTQDVVKLIDLAFGKLGLDGRTFTEGWHWACEEKTALFRQNYYLKNLEVMCHLESAHPGIISALHKQFGIINFARYPREILVEQYKNINNTTQKYGVILYPEYDWNSAFSDDTPQLRQLFLDSKNHFLVRVIECTGRRSAISIINRLRKRYGKISWIVVGGHGDDDGKSFRIGYLAEDSTVSVKDISRAGRSLLLGFENKPRLVLVSCSGGLPGGTAEEFNKNGFEVIATKVPTSLSSLRLKKRSLDQRTLEASFEHVFSKVTYR